MARRPLVPDPDPSYVSKTFERWTAAQWPRRSAWARRRWLAQWSAQVADLIAEVAARGGQPSQHAVAVRSMFDRISPTYDLLNRVMSAGIDRRWRARALTVLEEGLPEGPLLDSCA